jgi:hypothetical protein
MPAYDPARRRRGVRKPGERGLWVYVPAEELEAAGIAPNGSPPFYRLWPHEKAVLVRLYREA